MDFNFVEKYCYYALSVWHSCEHLGDVDWDGVGRGTRQLM